MRGMKQKLIDALGVVGVGIYYVFRLFASLLPFVMIDTSFFITVLLILAAQIVPFATPVLWVWGLFGALSGPQDFWAISYYILFALCVLPFLINLLKIFLSK
jgi:hypothetical protein